MEITNENQLQAALFTWAWNTYPQFQRMMWAVPNGQARTPYERNIAKATGLLAGVWDLHCFTPAGRFAILETKWGTNDLTVDRVVGGKRIFGQKEWGEIMVRNGALAYVYRDLPAGQAAYRDIFQINL
jgi:hypothetical protein